MALIDIARNNIAKQISEKNEQRLRRKRKNRKMLNLAFSGWKTHLPIKFSTEFECLIPPKAVVALARGAVVNAQFDGAVGSRVPIWKKC